MASKRLSPTASLLKNSRLFSLPPPLPRPSHNFTATSNFDSDTATLPYPTHASIETTQSSLSRGDWGLKRPLPQKSTANTSTPSIRIDDIDSIDHIADFESAADHTLTLKKWQEIGLPISMPVKQRGAYVSNASLNTRSTPPTSVFENTYDNTEKSDHQGDARRWKFKGPWLAGKTQGEFDVYLERHIKQRKLEFRTFVRNRLVKERRLEQRRKAQESGDEFDGRVEIADNDVDLYLKQLRQDEVRLYMLVEDFLDLPISADSNPSEGTFVAMMDSDQGPPKTHLSAGLTYLRTASHVTNHPVLGPMDEEPPVQARILRPQSTNVVIKHFCALLGIGGIVANDTAVRTMFQSNGHGEKPEIQRFDAEAEGGAKLLVLPDRASIDAHGRLKLHALRVSQADEAIYQNVVPQPVANQVPFYPKSSPMPRLDLFGKKRTGSSPAYGLRVDDSSQSPRTTSPPLDVPKNMDDSVKSLLDLLGPKQDN